MAYDPQQSPYFTHIDVSPTSSPKSKSDEPNTDFLLQNLLAGQQRTNELLEELTKLLSAPQKQRANEINQWKESHPYLSKSCREAAESLSNVQTEFLRQLTEEISDNSEHFLEGDFMLNEFVDRYGPRLAHLNGVLQVLSQLSAVTNAPNQQPEVGE
jgi:hypothetical protein